MNTAEALKVMTDRGLFEILVIAVIHKAKKEYANILQTGVNAAGEPVRSPVDGFCRAPESTPPHFLMVQATTIEKGALERKWLYGHLDAKKAKSGSASNDGDLIKAGRLAQEIRKKFPTAKFTIIMATNQRLDVTLVTKVYKKAEELNVNCDIWDQSRLADFLDTTPEGQFLRKRYLGIECEVLSESLLRKLCEQSLRDYENELFIANPNSLVPREVDERIQGGVHNNRYTIQFIVGESGFGKSVATYRTLQKHLESGAYGIWIPQELVKESISLASVLDKILRTLCPHLLPDAGKSALQFIQEGSQFLIVVDDINRTEDPMKLVRKLLAWSKPQKSDIPDSKQFSSPHLVVCPVWPHVWGLINHDFSKIPWVGTVFIGRMTPTEGTLAVRSAGSQAGIEITNIEAEALAKKMGNDPLLIGLFNSLLSGKGLSELNALAHNVVENFIASGVKEAASVRTASYLRTEYRKALSTVSSHMLRKRRLHPLWKEIEGWLEDAPDVSKALRELIQHSKLCRLTEQEQFVLRHDHIRDALLVESMTAMLASSTKDPDIFGEPFYAEIIGRALIRCPQNQEFLKELRNPLALVEAIRYFGTPTSDYHRTIIEEVKKWSKSHVKTSSVPYSLFHAVGWTLIETDSPVVLEITETFPSSSLVLLARLRNGSAKSGALYCFRGRDLEPSFSNKLRDYILEQAKCRHREKILRELKELLSSPIATTQERRGALALAGFLGFTDVKEDIAKCWDLATDKAEVLPEAIWAVTQCCGAEPNKLLDPLMAYWVGLSDEEDSCGMSQKARFGESLRFALARGISAQVINYFIAQCSIHESLRWPITYMCGDIDSPDAIEFIARSAADIQRKIAGTGRFSPWVLTLPDRWNVNRGGGRRLSQNSLARLKVLWENLKNDKFVKEQAFRLWVRGVGWEQIDTLRGITSNSSLFCPALWKRAELGDQSVVAELLPILYKETHWFYVAHHVWCEELMSVAQHHLEALKDNIPADFSGGQLNVHHDLSRLLMRIPTKDAEILLDKYWEHLGYSRLFIMAALYVGTPKCLELAASSISRCPGDIPLFKHVHFRLVYTESERQKYLTMRRLENLVPYLDRLGENEIEGLAIGCQQLGIPEWSQQHLADRLSEKYRKRYHPSDNDLLQDLDAFLEDSLGFLRVKYWLEEFDQRHDARDRVLNIVDRWLASHPTIKGLRIAAECVQAVGARKDLPILNKYNIQGSANEVANIKENARFFVYRRSLE